MSRRITIRCEYRGPRGRCTTYRHMPVGDCVSFDVLAELRDDGWKIDDRGLLPELCPVHNVPESTDQLAFFEVAR